MIKKISIAHPPRKYPKALIPRMAKKTFKASKLSFSELI